jgi:hypothetical protein
MAEGGALPLVPCAKGRSLPVRSPMAFVTREGLKTMDQLVSQVAQRTGISNDQAKQAVTMVVDFLKQRLPAPIASQVDAALSGQGSSGMAGEAEKAVGSLGGMFGNTPAKS